jgi:hypothetical protein
VDYLWNQESITKYRGIRIESSFREDLFWDVSFEVKDTLTLETQRRKLSTALSTKVAISFDECEQLAQEVDSLKGMKRGKTAKKVSRKTHRRVAGT